LSLCAFVTEKYMTNDYDRGIKKELSFLRKELALRQAVTS